MMSLWSISRTIAEHLRLGEEWNALNIIRSYPLEQKRFILTIKHQNSSLLFHAVTNKLFIIAVYFLQHCEADPNSVGLIDGKKLTCIADATLSNSPTLVTMLLDFHADIEMTLYYACKNERFQIAKILLERGANPNSRNSEGKTCLMVSMKNFELFKLLVSVGADVNLTDSIGETCLVLALKRNMLTVAMFLLGLEDTQVRLIGDAGTDALFHAVSCSPRHVIEKVIEKGSYTTEQVAMAYEMHSCEYNIIGYPTEARKFWKEALKLRRKSRRTPMFKHPRKAGKLKEVINLFNDEDIPPLSFLDSMEEFSLYTAHIYTIAIWNVNDAKTYIKLCKFLLRELETMEDRDVFRLLVHASMSIVRFFNSDNFQKSYGLEMLKLLVRYTEQIKARLHRMTWQERSVYGFKIDYLVAIVIRSAEQIYWKFPENAYLFYDLMKRLINLDLRGPCQKSLLQKCAVLNLRVIEPLLVVYRANVNSSDRLGKTILHDLIETAAVSPKLTRLIINHGFDFRAVKYDEYCLPCRLEKIGVLPNPKKHISLQCLAVKTFCEYTMTSFSDVPRHLMSLVKSHLYD